MLNDFFDEIEEVDDEDFDEEGFLIEELEAEIALLEMINSRLIEENEKLREQLNAVGL